MKGITSIVIILVLTSCFLTGSVSKTKIINNVDRYQYPISLASDDWFDYTVLEKSEMLRISQEDLDKMSDLQLIYAIADYPYFGDVYAYGFDKKGLETFAQYCSAFAELLSRVSFRNSLAKYGRKIALEYEADTRDKWSHLRAELILDMVSFFSTSYTDPHRSSQMIIYTPNGTAVVATLPDEYHAAFEHSGFDDYYVNHYGVARVYIGSCLYNCHSFAWSWPSPSNYYWIANPQAYMTDGSYSLVFSGSTSSVIVSYGASQNDIIHYTNGDHSAILTGNPANGVPLVCLEAISKWGPNGVFRHLIGNVPSGYQPSIVSIWH